MKQSIFYFLYISIILILVSIILLFVTNFTLTRFVPDNLINLRIHQPNSEFIQELSQSVIKSSNDSIEIKQYIIKTGEHGEIIGTECGKVSKYILFVGASTLEQKLIDQNKRTDSILQNLFNKNEEICVMNFAYGGNNLAHVIDTIYYLLSHKQFGNSVVITMSNATDIGQLITQGSYDHSNNHDQKKIRHFTNHELFKSFIYRLKSRAGLIGENLVELEISNPLIEYQKALKNITNLLEAYKVNHYHILEPRKKLSLNIERNNFIKKRYSRKNGITYDKFYQLHSQFNLAAIKLSETSKMKIIDARGLSNETYLYDEGHLNNLGTSELAELIYTQIKLIEY